jgi:diadenosine tetraphosphate (Ap4A) HIT family hydrolase/ADP-ribose pyrophosphatase YjhB (NUDIX family)
MDSSNGHASQSSAQVIKTVIPNYKPDCSLCQIALHARNQGDFVCELKHVVVHRGPFAHRWPGSLQVTAKRHLKDPSQLRYPHFIHTQAELYVLESAVRKTTSAKHMNVVKFGNVVEHLHWHLIPRFANETHPNRTPWELADLSAEALFHTPFTVSRDDLYAQILSDLDIFKKNIQPPFYSTAFFIRPIATEAQQNFFNQPLTLQQKIITTHHQDFECFLMQRNYLDFAWDTFGGEADPGETPHQTLLRELYEELGWKVSDSLELTRHWQNGMLRGFCYLVTPDKKQLLEQQPTRVESHEVKQAAWFPLNDLVINKDGLFSDQLCGRARALVAAEPDFYI